MELGKYSGLEVIKLESVLSVHPQVCRRHLLYLPRLLPSYFPLQEELPVGLSSTWFTCT